MDYIKTVEAALREYKSKKSVIETTESRIEAYRKMIEESKEVEVILTSQAEPGMPRSHGHGGSQAEFLTLRGEAAVKQLNEWIKEEESRIYPLQLEIEQIDKAMMSLNAQERFIIECKYFEKMIWRDIEHSVNEKFRHQEYITTRGLQHQIKALIERITSILKPFYEKLGPFIVKNWQDMKSA